MNVFHTSNWAGPTGDTPGHAIAIGVFDGVHSGHKEVIRRTRLGAKTHGLATAVVTFDPHPAYVLRPENAPKLITCLDHKLELLNELDVDTVLVVAFDKNRAKEPADRFVKRLLVEQLQAGLVVVGHDFHFGARRSGNVALLTKLGEIHNFEVEGLRLLDRGDGPTEPISSTAIRRALAGGDVTTAAKLLGRFHEVRGTVVGGDKRGRQIGFPTANIEVDRQIAVPADAVYAAYCERSDGTVWPCAVNIGKRPTFHRDAHESLLEAHLIDFDSDLYGEEVKIRFVRLIRSEQRFDGVEALVAQLNVDVANISTILASSGS